jgi:DNA-binding MarR family transcriptional regulator
MTFHATSDEETWFGLLLARELVVNAMSLQLEQDHDLSLPAFIVLMSLAKHDESLSIGELVPLVGIVSRSQVSRLVDRLEERSLVSRVESVDDARVRTVRITTSGHRLLSSARATAVGASSEVLGKVTAADRTALRRMWIKLNPA